MTVTLLGSGPSLMQYDGKGEAVIAVNRAVEAHASTWWCFGDDRTFLHSTPIGKPKLFVGGEAYSRLHNVLQPCNVVTWETLRCDVRGWSSWSATAALVLAHHLGATIIKTYGIDRTGIADWDGHEFAFGEETAASSRTEDRWRRERVVWDAVVRHLGVYVDGGGRVTG